MASEGEAIGSAAARLAGDSMAGVWRLDPGRSSVRFRVKHFWGLITVRGSFTKFEGSATIDRAGAISGSMRIDATSVETGHSKRDQHLRTADFFDADNHPTISFSTGQVSPRGDQHVAVDGELTAAGRTRPISFDARVTEVDAEAGRVTVDAEITLDRSEFEMTWSPLRMASSTVVVSIDGELVRAQAI
jgi:polyisoprenoid-binding protein YceI